MGCVFSRSSFECSNCGRYRTVIKKDVNGCYWDHLKMSRECEECYFLNEDQKRSKIIQAHEDRQRINNGATYATCWQTRQ